MSKDQIRSIASYNYLDHRQDEILENKDAISENKDEINTLEKKLENLDETFYNYAHKTSSFERIRRDDIRDFAEKRSDVLQYIHLMPSTYDLEDYDVDDYFKKYLTESNYKEFTKIKQDHAGSDSAEQVFVHFCENLKMADLKPFAFRWENWKQSYPGKQDDF